MAAWIPCWSACVWTHFSSSWCTNVEEDKENVNRKFPPSFDSEKGSSSPAKHTEDGDDPKWKAGNRREEERGGGQKMRVSGYSEFRYPGQRVRPSVRPSLELISMQRVHRCWLLQPTRLNCNRYLAYRVAKILARRVKCVHDWIEQQRPRSCPRPLTNCIHFTLRAFSSSSSSSPLLCVNSPATARTTVGGSEQATTMSRTGDLLLVLVLPNGIRPVLLSQHEETNGYHRFAHS